eukprot:COSAG01_NODE_1674_length_9542_cov_35.944827_1_plen_34_part_10
MVLGVLVILQTSVRPVVGRYHRQAIPASSTYFHD